MNVGSQHFRTIWLKPDDETVVQLIDQRFLPHWFVIEEVRTIEQMATAIREMHVRGAGLIGASAGYGMYLAAVKAAARPAGEIDEHLSRAAAQLKATRPTAVNLSWAIERQLRNIAKGTNAKEKVALALRTARSIADEDADHCRMIGQHGFELIRQIAREKAGKFAAANPSRRTAGGPSSSEIATVPLVDHSFYTTVHMVRTIEALLGLPPMNNNDAHVSAMAPLFSGHGDQPAFTADYRNRDNGLLYEMNPPKAPGSAASALLDFSHPDAADADTLNRILWRAAKGRRPMPRPRHNVFPAGDDD